MWLQYARIYSIYDLQKRKKVYVGQTTIKDDYTPHGNLISMAFARQKERFIYCFEREWINGILSKDLDIQELRFIVRLHTWRQQHPDGLNVKLGGTSSRMTEETKKKMSESKKALYADPAQRERFKEYSVQAYKKQETKDKLREASQSPIVKERRRQSNIKHFTDEEIRTAHAVKIQHIMDNLPEETRAKIAQGGKNRSLENRAKDSATMTALNADPAYQAKCRAGLTEKSRQAKREKMQAKHADPEYKAAFKLKMKAAMENRRNKQVTTV